MVEVNSEMNYSKADNRNMTRRGFLKVLDGSSTALSLGCFAPRQIISRRPNILLIMADDHALEAVSSYGSYLSQFAKTPNIDRIGHEGMRFTNCCCNNSICSPSRATFLTGQYSHKNGVLGLAGTISDTAPWFSTQLQQAGYQTCVVGKWHLGNNPKGFSNYWVTN